MDLSISADAKAFIDARGGVAYVRPHRHRCCQGAMTLLDVMTTAPDDAEAFLPVTGSHPEVRFHEGSAARPQALTVELHGTVRPHLVAYWDGCVFRI